MLISISYSGFKGILTRTAAVHKLADQFPKEYLPRHLAVAYRCLVRCSDDEGLQTIKGKAQAQREAGVDLTYAASGQLRHVASENK